MVFKVTFNNISVLSIVNFTRELEWVIVIIRQFIIFSAISWREEVNFQWDDDEVRLDLEQHADTTVLRLTCRSTRNTLFWFRANQAFLSPYCCVLSGEATNTNFIIFGLTRTRGEHTIHYATDVIKDSWKVLSIYIRWDNTFRIQTKNL